MKKEKGIVFYKDKNGNYYYINQYRMQVYIENIILIDTDWIYKDVIRRTTKLYTFKGYNIISNNLFIKNNAIQTNWISLREFNKEKKSIAHELYC